MRDAMGRGRRDTLRLPPYGAEILAARRRGQSVNVFIYAGVGAWRLAGMKRHAIPVPSPGDWKACDWRLVDGIGVTLVARGWDFALVVEFAEHLVRTGADPVSAIRVASINSVVSVFSDVFRRKERPAS